MSHRDVYRRMLYEHVLKVPAQAKAFPQGFIDGFQRLCGDTAKFGTAQVDHLLKFADGKIDRAELLSLIDRDQRKFQS